MKERTLEVTLTLLGPIMTRSTAAGAPGIDSPMARSGDAYCLPGTLIKGHLREAWTELAELWDFKADIRQWLGDRAGNWESVESERSAGAVQPTSFEPVRGRIVFGDFIAPLRPRPGALYRIQIDSDRGSVKTGALLTVEAPFGPGERVTFTGRISFVPGNDGEAADIVTCLDRGLRYIPALGALRGCGFGRLLDVELKDAQPATIGGAQPDTAPGGDAIGVALRLDRPFCLARRRPGENLFESDSAIPGAALKGALATTWVRRLGGTGAVGSGMDLDRPDLAAHFERIRFTHAFPSEAKTRPVVPPLSLVFARGRPGPRPVGKTPLYDVALLEGPHLIERAAPAFAVDWKEDDTAIVRDLFGWTEPKRELRVRTGIEPGKNRAKEGQLFAYEMVRPGDLVWHGRVDLSRVEASARPKVRAQLLDLLAHGISGLGKTKADVAVEIGSPAEPHVPSAPHESLLIVSLQTPALLADPAVLKEDSGETELRKAYEDCWADLSSDREDSGQPKSGTACLALVRYFASQSLAGGLYLHRRFNKGEAYHPYLLTDAGSVFVLQPRAQYEERARSLIEDWREHGLPMPSWAAQRHGTGWNQCPYIPENGYGEVVVDLGTHVTLKPPKVTAIPRID